MLPILRVRAAWNENAFDLGEHSRSVEPVERLSAGHEREGVIGEGKRFSPRLIKRRVVETAASGDLEHVRGDVDAGHGDAASDKAARRESGAASEVKRAPVVQWSGVREDRVEERIGIRRAILLVLDRERIEVGLELEVQRKRLM